MLSGMDSIYTHIEALVGPIPAIIIALMGLALYAGLPLLVRAWPNLSPGSPRSLRYWKRELETRSAICHDLEGACSRGQDEASSRLREAVVHVDAYQAKKYMGLSGPGYFLVMGIILAFLTLVMADVVVLLNVSGPRRLLAWAGVVVYFLITAAMFLGYLFSRQAIQMKVTILVVAGRYGHGNWVRQNPWRVIDIYERWQNGGFTKAQVNAYSKAQNKQKSRWTRFENSLISYRPRRSLINVSSDIWEELDRISLPPNDPHAADASVSDADDLP
jgi:hypothetical protein